jgi:hypothetical protein
VAGIDQEETPTQKNVVIFFVGVSSWAIPAIMAGILQWDVIPGTRGPYAAYGPIVPGINPIVNCIVYCIGREREKFKIVNIQKHKFA